MRLRNGDTPDAPVIFTKCGTDTPTPNPATPLRSMTNSLWLEFHSDADNLRGSGFEFAVSAHSLGCGGVFHGGSGNISSPVEGSKYPEGAECVWEMRNEPGFHTVYDFYGRFDVENVNGCNNDYIEVNMPSFFSAFMIDAFSL